MGTSCGTTVKNGYRVVPPQEAVPQQQQKREQEQEREQEIRLRQAVLSSHSVHGPVQSFSFSKPHIKISSQQNKNISVSTAIAEAMVISKESSKKKESKKKERGHKQVHV